MTHKRMLLPITVVLLASACSGPGVPLDVGVKEFPTDILLGAQSGGTPIDHVPAPIPVPLPPAPVDPGRDREPPPKPVACPQAHPFATPKRELRSAPVIPPQPASYPFRVSGSVTSGAATAKLPEEVVRTVEKVVTEPGGAFTFDVVSDLTRTSFRVVPRAAGLDQAGIFMTKQILGAVGAQVELAPTPPVKLLQFPVENGAEWDSVSTDTDTQTTWVIHGSVGVLGPDPSDPDQQVLNPTMRVDACGEWLEGWAVRITGPDGEGPARIVSPTMNLEFTATYAFGTHYGSLALFDETMLEGTISGTSFTYHNISSIKREPLVPGEAAA